jgi:hypothetical protein
MAGERRTDEFGRGRAVAGEGGLDAELDRAVPSGDALAYLVQLAGDQPGKVFALHHNTIIIGRASDVDVTIVDGSVSTHHARIINGPHGFEIEDLDSTNGTMIADQRVTRGSLHSGDRVVIGRVELVFLLDRPTAVTVQLPGRGTRPAASSALVPAGTTLLRPRGTTQPPTSRPQQGPVPIGVVGSSGVAGAPARDRDSDEGMSLVEILVRVMRFLRFLRPRARAIAACLSTFVGIGLLSMFLIPPRSQAVCELKLVSDVKTNPVTEQERRAEDASLMFFQSPERNFVQGDLVRASLAKVGTKDPTEAELLPIVTRLKLEFMGDHMYRASFTDNVINRGKPPPLAFLPAHVQTFIQSEIDHALREFNARVKFLGDQVKGVDADLSRINEERTRFREANADKLPEDSQMTHTTRFQLDSRKADLTAQVRRLQADLVSARQQVAADRPAAQTRYQSSQTYRESLATVNRKLSEAYASGLADGHPEVQQLKDEKGRLEDLIKSQLQSSTDTDRKADPGLQAEQGKIEALEAQLAAARSDLADTDKNLGQMRRLVDALPRVEQQLIEMTNQMESTTKLRGQLFERLKQAELQLNLEQVSAQSRYDIGRIRLERPSRAKTMALRCGVGLFVGILVVAAWLLAGEGRRLITEAMAKLDNAVPRS